MGGFFRLDGPFFKYGTILCDLIILSILWFLGDIFIVTIGASTTALYYVTTRLIASHEGYVTKDFFKSYFSNIIQGCVAGVFLTVALFVILFNIRNLHASSLIWQIVMILQFVLAFELIITSMYVFPIIARFKMKLFDIFKMAFFMANRHFFTTITCVALLAAVFVIAFYVYPIISWFFLPGLYAYLTSYMIMRVFKKYMPEMDADISLDGKNILEEKHKAEKKAEEEKK